MVWSSLNKELQRLLRLAEDIIAYAIKNQQGQRRCKRTASEGAATNKRLLPAFITHNL